MSDLVASGLPMISSLAVDSIPNFILRKELLIATSAVCPTDCKSRSTFFVIL